MNEGNNLGFTVNTDFEDISSTSEKGQKYEDIVSDSSRVSTSSSGSVNFNAFADYEDDDIYYRKKKRGAAKFFNDSYYKIRKWWKCMSRLKKGLLITTTALFLAVVSLLVYLFSVFDYNYNSITKDPENLGFDTVINEEIINVALFGIDSRNFDTFKGNSDSIMILSINTKTKKIKIISIMRDSLVPIEKNGKTIYNKINSAYATGPELAIKTLNQNFGLDISEYATVNFNGMMDIIDAVGGIDVTLTEREVKARGVNNHGINDMIAEACTLLKKNPKDYYVTEWGDQHLNGIQAVAYSRIRYVQNIWGTNNDYGRTDRQRFVMEQLFNKAKTLSKSQYIDLAKALIPCTETSLSYSEIINIAFNVMFDSPTFEQARIPLNENGKNFLMTSPKGSFGSVVYYDLNYASKIIHAFIYDDIAFDDFIAQNPIEKNDWYRKAVGGSSTGTSSKPTTSTAPPSNDDDDDDGTSSDSSGSSSDSSSGTSSDSSGDEDGTSSGTGSDDGTSSGTEGTDDDDSTESNTGGTTTEDNGTQEE